MIADSCERCGRHSIECGHEPDQAMVATPTAFQTNPIDLGRGIAVEFRFANGRMDAIWSPRMPHGRRGRQIMPAYRRARHQFLSGVAEKLGILIAVADVGPDVGGAHG